MGGKNVAEIGLLLLLTLLLSLLAVLIVRFSALTSCVLTSLVARGVELPVFLV